MIKPEDEASLRLVAFGAALIAIAIRQSTLQTDDLGIPKQPLALSEWIRGEARMIADAIVLEAQRLEGKS
jgi:hypothetical protein